MDFLETFVRGKHSSLIRKLVIYRQKVFYNIVSGVNLIKLSLFTLFVSKIFSKH
jgi:hypothetical protein